MFKERRKFPRANVKYEVNIVCEGSVILGAPKNYSFHTYTENISEGGLKVILEKELETGSLLKLELFLSDSKSMPVKCKGMVVWTKKANPEGTSPDLFGTGIQFIELNTVSGYTLISGIVKKYLENSQDRGTGEKV